jgi:lipoyl(octanoyl) transferase
MQENIQWLESEDLVDFSESLPFMEKWVEKIINNEESDLIWFLEHSPILTAGISAKDEDLLNAGEIPVVKTNRGGKYTYHGPKMRIIYLMFDLKKFFAPNKPDIAKFVEFLENWIINSLKELGIYGEIKKGRVGIWVNHNGAEKKIAAIGIKVKKWVTYHGIAINLDPDLSAFDAIVPCGIKEFGVTSIREILGEEEFKKQKISENLNDLLKRNFFATYKNWKL